MLALTCAKCGRKFTPTENEVQVYLERAEGRKHALVPCPHCGKDTKVATNQLQLSLRFTPAQRQ